MRLARLGGQLRDPREDRHLHGAELGDHFFASTHVAAPGKLYGADNVGGTTSVDLTTAVGDMQTAYTDAAGRKVAGTLTMAGARNVVLAGGAQAKNIFWQVSGAVTIGANTHFDGIVLGQTGITLGNLASINGRMLAQTAVVLDANTVVIP